MFKKNVVLFVVFTAFCLLSISIIDPDFFWHVRYGSDVLKMGVPTHDLYSYTMPSFPYVDHSLLVSIIFTLLNSKFGYVSVCLLVSSVATAGAILCVGNKKWLAPLVAGSLVFNFGARALVFSFLFTVLIVRFTDLFFKNKKTSFILLPLFMALWANVHGGFSLGIIYLWGYFVVDVLVFKRKEYSNTKKFIIFSSILISTLATLITPYKTGTWEEAYRTIFSPNLKKYIAEWQGAQNLPSFSSLAVLSLFILAIYKQKKLYWMDIFTILLFIQGIFSIRLLPLAVIPAAQTISNAYDAFILQNKKRINLKRLNKAAYILGIIFILIFVVESGLQIKKRLDLANGFYPSIESIQYLKTNQQKGNIFSLFHWNNYLLVNTKFRIFVDGRMPVWSQHSNNNELDNAFLTYINILQKKIDYLPIFDKYCIDYVLWSKNTPYFMQVDIGKIWTKRYEDNNSILYVRKLPQNCTFSHS